MTKNGLKKCFNKTFRVVEKGLYCLLFLCLSLVLFSCNNANLESESISSVSLNSSVTWETLTNIHGIINDSIESTTRSLPTGETSINTQLISESSAKEIIAPLITDGKALQKQIIDSSDEENISAEDMEMIENATDEQLAELSLIVSSIEIDPMYGYISGAKLKSCAGVALGISAIAGIISGTKSLMTATSALKIFKIVGLRYLGYWSCIRSL